MLPCEVTLGLQAGLISRWLAHCRFDNEDNSGAGRKQAIREMLKWEYDNFEMCTILNTLVTDDQARVELISQGLADASAMENNTIDDVMEQIWIVTNRSAEVDGGPDSGPMMRRGRRVREESIEEQALRRRRREAMVLGQDGRAVEGNDIIERDDVLSDEDMEQPQVISETVETEAEDDQTWWDWRPWSVLRAGLVEEF